MPAFVRLLSQILAPISRAALWLASLGLVLMTFFVAWQIFGRKILNDTPSWTEPGSLVLMSWFILLGGAVGVREGDHLGFEIGLHYAPPRLRLAMQTTTYSLVTIFGLYMLIYGWQLTAATWGQKMAGIAIPQGMDYLPMVGGGALIALFAFEKLVNLFVAKDTLPPTIPASLSASVE